MNFKSKTRDLTKNPYKTPQGLEPTQTAEKEVEGYKARDDASGSQSLTDARYYAYQPKQDESGNVSEKELKKSLNSPIYVVSKDPTTGMITSKAVKRQVYTHVKDPATGETKRVPYIPNRNLSPEGRKAESNLSWKPQPTEKQREKEEKKAQHLAGALIKENLPQTFSSKKVAIPGKMNSEGEWLPDVMTDAFSEGFTGAFAPHKEDEYIPAMHAQRGDIKNYADIDRLETSEEARKRKEKQDKLDREVKERAEVLDKYYGLGKQQEEIDALAEKDPIMKTINEEMPYKEFKKLVGVPSKETHKVTKDGDVVPHDYGLAQAENLGDKPVSFLREYDEVEAPSEETPEQKRRSHSEFLTWRYMNRDENIEYNKRHRLARPSWSDWHTYMNRQPEWKEARKASGKSEKDFINSLNFFDVKRLEEAVKERQDREAREAALPKSEQAEKDRQKESAENAASAEESRKKNHELTMNPVGGAYATIKKGEKIPESAKEAPLYTPEEHARVAKELAEIEASEKEVKEEEEKKNRRKFWESSEGFGFKQDYPNSYKGLMEKYKNEDDIPISEVRKRMYYSRPNQPGKKLEETNLAKLKSQGVDTSQIKAYDLKTDSFIDPTPGVEYFLDKIYDKDGNARTILLPKGRQKIIDPTTGTPTYTTGYFVQDPESGKVLLHALPRIATPEKGESNQDFEEVRNMVPELSTESPNFDWLSKLADSTTATAFRKGERWEPPTIGVSKAIGKKKQQIELKDFKDDAKAQEEKKDRAKKRAEMGMSQEDDSDDDLVSASLASQIKGGNLRLGNSRKPIGGRRAIAFSKKGS